MEQSHSSNNKHFDETSNTETTRNAPNLSTIMRQLKNTKNPPLSPQQILQLQPIIGNLAVQRLLKHDTANQKINLIDTINTTTMSPLQRQPTDDEEVKEVKISGKWLVVQSKSHPKGERKHLRKGMKVIILKRIGKWARVKVKYQTPELVGLIDEKTYLKTIKTQSDDGPHNAPPGKETEKPTTPQPKAEFKQVKKTGKWLVLRSRSNRKGKRVLVKKGTLVAILKRRGRWAKVKVQDDQGLVGKINEKRYLEAVTKKKPEKPAESSDEATKAEDKDSAMPQTDFQKTAAKNGYTVVANPDDGSIIGYYRNRDGVEQIVDILGKPVWSNEKPLETPLLDPIDFIPIGMFGKVFTGAAKGLAKVLILGIAKKGGKQIASKTGLSILSKLRTSSANAVKKMLEKAGGWSANRSIEKMLKATPELFTQKFLTGFWTKSPQSFVIAMVRYWDVKASKKGAQFIVDTFGVETVLKGKGLFQRSLKYYEQAAVKAAREAGCKSVRVGWETVVSDKLRDILTKQGYSKIERLNADGSFSYVFGKIINL